MIVPAKQLGSPDQEAQPRCHQKAAIFPRTATDSLDLPGYGLWTLGSGCYLFPLPGVKQLNESVSIGTTNIRFRIARKIPESQVSGPRKRCCRVTPGALP